MIRTAKPRIEECCSWCRQPVTLCTKPSCDDARTYSGVLERGEWRVVEDQRERSGMLALAA